MTSDPRSEKVEKLVASAATSFLSYAGQVGVVVTSTEAEELVRKVVADYLVIVPPHKDAKHGLVSVKPAGRGATSVKLGNVTLNLGKFIQNISSGALICAGVVGHPILIPLALIVVSCSTYDALSLPLNEHDVAVITSMSHKDAIGFAIPFDTILEIANDQLRTQGHREVTAIELEESLSRLIEMHCIGKSREKQNSWFLKEEITIAYT